MAFFGCELEEDLEAELLRAERLTSGRYGAYRKWDLIDKQSNKTIGSAGYHNWHAEHERAELGYALYAEWRGQGFMTEGLKAIIKHGFVDKYCSISYSQK